MHLLAVTILTIYYISFTEGFQHNSDLDLQKNCEYI